MKLLLQFAAVLQLLILIASASTPRVLDWRTNLAAVHPFLLGLRRIHRDGHHRVCYPNLFARRRDGRTRTGGALTLRFHRDFLGRPINRAIRCL